MSHSREIDEIVVLAAQRLVRRHGPDFTMGQLADELGVSRATLYRRGPSKLELLRVLEQLGDVSKRALASTRERIMDATAEDICQRGFQHTSIEQIAKRAGVSPVTVYRMFETRENLLIHFIDERSPRKDAGRILEQHGKPLQEVLTEFVETALSWACAHPGLWRAMMFVEGEAAAMLQMLRRDNKGTYVRLVAFMEHHANTGCLVAEPPHLLAADLMGAVAGSALLDQRLQAHGDAPAQVSVRDRAARVVETFLFGRMKTGA